jgi:CBS-domain-containing membrane protein
MSDKHKTVGDVMTRQVMVLNVEDNLDKVMKAMEHFHIRHVPVVDGEKVVGMVTQRDMLAVMHSKLGPNAPEAGGDTRLYERTFVINVMTKDPVTVSPETPLKDAVKLLRENKIGGFPVIAADGKLVGVMTETDVLKVLEALLEAEG